jgi:hypothetical protein
MHKTYNDHRRLLPRLDPSLCRFPMSEPHVEETLAALTGGHLHGCSRFCGMKENLRVTSDNPTTRRSTPNGETE